MRVLLPLSLSFLCGCVVEPEALTIEDVHVQGGNPAVDVLFVVDDTASMAEVQSRFAAAATSFVQPLVARPDVDARIAVISTDMDDPSRRGRIVGPVLHSLDGIGIASGLQSAIVVGTAGSARESGFEAAWAAITPPLSTHDNGSFRRASARLVIVILSDEDDCSDEGALPSDDPAACASMPESLVPVSTWLLRFQGLEDNPWDLSVHAVVETGAIAESEGCGTTNPGVRYMEMAERTGGIVAAWCDDAADVFSRLGREAAGYRQAFPLSRTPVQESIRVEVQPDGGTASPVPEDPAGVEGWSYDSAANTIHLWGTSVPPIGTTLRIRYDIGIGT